MKSEATGQFAPAAGLAAGVESEVCSSCDGHGIVVYNPNLNPNAFPGTAVATCPYCCGTGSVDKSELSPNPQAERPAQKETRDES